MTKKTQPATSDRHSDAGVPPLDNKLCMLVPPSPEAQEKIKKELDKLQKRDSPFAANISFRQNNPVGLDDGLIFPGTLFPLGTTASVASNAAADRAPLRGAVRVAVVLVNFTDRAIAQPVSHYTDLFFSLGVVPTGSVREYYREVSNNAVDIQGQVIGPVTLSHPMSYYAHGASGRGNALPNARTMAQEAAQLANPLINFGSYDNDGNGFVDAFIVIHAGRGAEETLAVTDIWSHKWVLPSVFAADGKSIYAYLTVPEDCKLGVCAHELGHLLFGFPDLYDTDEINASEGIGNWCLMAGGSWNGGGNRPAHPSAWCKVQQGWVTVVNQTTNGLVSLPDVKSSFRVNRLWKTGSAGSEYFLVENRQKTGFDDHLPQGGLLIWHIDDAVANNTNEAHYKVALMQADGLRDLEKLNGFNRGDGGDPYPGTTNNRSFTSSSNPNSNSYAGSSTCVAITSISDSAATMSAQFQVRCKVLVKEIKDKDVVKDKELAKERKELIKEKELAKEHKDLIFEKPQPDKQIKEKDKDKDIFEKPGDGKFNDGKLADQGGGGFGFGGGTPDVLGRVSALESRMNALEPFISQSLRPDLINGAYRQETDQAAVDPELDAASKRTLDSKVPDTL
ncbi:hypothetical protein BH09BAC4_BH09BAC4_17640 [soil metagenome]